MCVRACVHSCESACLSAHVSVCVYVMASGGRGRGGGSEGGMGWCKPCAAARTRSARETCVVSGAIPTDVQLRRRPTDEKGARIVSTDGVTHASTQSTPCECPREPLARIASTDRVRPTRGLCTCKGKGTGWRRAHDGRARAERRGIPQLTTQLRSAQSRPRDKMSVEMSTVTSLFRNLFRIFSRSRLSSFPCMESTDQPCAPSWREM
jgi:hypothetical protein